MAISRSFLVTAVAGMVAAQNKTTVSISVPLNLSTRALVPDVYGYSIEPVWLDSYINTSLASTLLGHIVNVAGKAPPIRIGGNTADQTYLYPSSPLPLTRNDSAAIPDAATATRFNITPRWFDTWATYFPPGTELIYTLNLRDNSSNWANAVAQAAAARAALGDSLVAFELGNEIDHFINKGWRDASWGVKEYIEQFRNLTGQITGSEWYQSLGNNNVPSFQAAVFADPPLVPDQHDEIDDFSIANLTAAGIASRPQEKKIISSYATHLYPQSTCDTARWYRMRLDLLSDHAVLWKNVSQYIPQVHAADEAGAPLVMGETNSASCSGKSGISDTFGAALWGVDYVLTAASIGFRKVYFHLGARSEYSSFTPLLYELKNETLAPGIRAGWYAHYFLARVVSHNCERRAEFRIAALPSANSSELSGFAVYDGGVQLRKLVLLDMGVWNGTEGLANPSTLTATDGTMFSEGTRPVSSFEVATPWTEGDEVKVVRLTGPGTNAKSNVTVAGTVFDDSTGDPVVGGDGSVQLGDEYSEIAQVGANGVLRLDVQRAEGVLLEKTVVCADEGDDDRNSPTPGTSKTSRAEMNWFNILAALICIVEILA
ncbi:glycoside hydrolase superfamily [Xylaria bambusicola]|uniref:glycoside hydrolase superfamily n=1 Tax=Xylaria bambusicola TaxID=326684 RepID=UPI002007AAC5|nr:glycoside hydrolase superfamily [Xylaria bambusicola]KAI0505519.1 glycoside hydrolase superfamily [Xylaria bambusicola]